MIEKLVTKGCSKTFLRFICTFSKHSTNRIKWVGEFSTDQQLRKGVRQGKSMSSLLFDLYFDGLTETVSNGRTTLIHLNEKDVFILKFADDVVAISPSESHLQ